MKLVDACPWGNYENYFYYWHKRFTEGYLKDGDLSSVSDFTGFLKEVAGQDKFDLTTYILACCDSFTVQNKQLQLSDGGHNQKSKEDSHRVSSRRQNSFNWADAAVFHIALLLAPIPELIHYVIGCCRWSNLHSFTCGWQSCSDVFIDTTAEYLSLL